MVTGQKLDLYKLHKEEYVAPRKPVIVDVGPARYLAVAGKGEPGGSVFTARLGCLYNVAFTLKMAKKVAGRDYAVAKLEGLWWGGRAGADFFSEPRQQWHWKLLIRTPDFITEQDRQGTIEALLQKHKPAEVADVQLETLIEGPCVQMLHVGPYSNESDTIAKMQACAAERGLSFHGLHHEIYLSDPRRVPPARLRTILRHPVSSAPKAARD
jgi:hypothetical protein